MGSHETIDGGPLPIDLEHLSQYTADDPAITREVLTLFRDQADIWLSSLRDAGDLQAWKDAAHTMKGASRGVGAEEVATLAEEAELLAALEGSQRAEIFGRVEIAVRRATRYAAQILEDSPFVG